MKTYIFLIAFLVLLSLAIEDPFVDEEYESGIVDIKEGDDMFYWLMRSRKNPSKDPLVVWISGGPGCGAELGIFYEHGPWNLQEDLSLEFNKNSWNEAANVLYVDQPFGTGFSSSESIWHLARNHKTYSEAFYKFIGSFMEKYPEFKGRELFFAGVSYAGHSIPAITTYIVDQQNPDLNLKAVALGNGWVSPVKHFYAYPKFSLENGLITPQYAEFLKFGYWMCEIFVKAGLNTISYIPCQLLTSSILGAPWNPKFSIYDIRQSCEDGGCENHEVIEPFLNNPEIQDLLNVPRREYVTCNPKVQLMLLNDQGQDMTPMVQSLLDNDIGVLVYSGDKDFICNWRGGEAWTSTLDVNGQTLSNQEYSPWTVDGEGAGEYRKAGGLTFLRVYDAGHEVPSDQPERALDMFKKFLSREF